MGKNIVIAFVSTFSGLEKKDYSYKQDGETRSVSGMLTNEAPIKYLLREYPAIDQIYSSTKMTAELTQPDLM